MKLTKKCLFSGLTTLFIFTIAWGANDTTTIDSTQYLAANTLPNIKALENKINVTFSIECDTLLEDVNRNKLNFLKRRRVPEDGDIYPTNIVTLLENESVFDLLLRLSQENEFELDYSNLLFSDATHIESIGNFEKSDAGRRSGWIYRVNGIFPNYSCTEYKLSDGDVVEWLYTCDYGRDLNNGNRVYQ
ncbi:DUF4430 domain-containing protein [Candidatus Epulonipiscium viviparus]|uniref:DUF4430 domain-containing protein n=1 Tax=Candidatus Epulonipiscium viviparus TaxID=420336 RepID=UPI0027380D1B|nr:DUF4430 domain-containing protein [Candidatus Epulopiscium viviparus]